MTTPASGSSTRAFRARVALAAASSPSLPASSASPPSPRPSMRRGTACGPRRRFSTSPTNSAEILISQRLSEKPNGAGNADKKDCPHSRLNLRVSWSVPYGGGGPVQETERADSRAQSPDRTAGADPQRVEREGAGLG